MIYLTKSDGSKFTEEELEFIAWGEYESIKDIDLSSAEVVDEDEWIQDGKYQFRNLIFKYQDKFYALPCSRSGSPFTDWYYEYDQPYEVVKQQKVIEVWTTV